MKSVAARIIFGTSVIPTVNRVILARSVGAVCGKVAFRMLLPVHALPCVADRADGLAEFRGVEVGATGQG